MPIPGRRLRSCLTAPRRAERAFRRVASSALIRLARAIAPSHPHSAQPSAPSTPNPSPPQTLPESEAEASDTPPAQPTQGSAPNTQNLPPSVHGTIYPQPVQAPQSGSSSVLHTRTSTDDDELHPEHHELPGATYNPPAQAVPAVTSLQTDTPQMPLSPALSALQPGSSSSLHTRADDDELHPEQHELPGATYSPPAQAAPAAFFMRTDTPPPPPPPPAAHDSPPPSPPLFPVEPPASHFPPAASYEMTPQGAYAPLAGPSSHHHEGVLPQSRPFQPPAAIDLTPQQHAHALAAFVPAPITVQDHLRTATPPTISPRVALGDMEMTRFMHQELDEEVAPSGPRISWRGSPYHGESPPRVHTNRALALPEEMPADGNAVASGSGLPMSEVENRDAVVGSMTSGALDTPGAPISHSLPDPPPYESFESQRSAQEPDTPPAASTSSPSMPQAVEHVAAEQIEAEGMDVDEMEGEGEGEGVQDEVEAGGMVGEELEGGDNENENEEMDVDDGQEHVGVQEEQHDVALDRTEGEDNRNEVDVAGTSSNGHAGPIPAPEEYVYIRDLRAAARTVGIALPEDRGARGVLGSFTGGVAALRDDLEDTLSIASSALGRLEALRGELQNNPSALQTIDRIMNGLKRSKDIGARRALPRDAAVAQVPA
ncbi:hypothetical protein PENSPDRAFT_657217 [Peniophora sp. CONT]|nr:hypothetical protein PENSPDRAFT_657217 [Peniophora sp. CONT]